MALSSVNDLSSSTRLIISRRSVKLILKQGDGLRSAVLAGGDLGLHVFVGRHGLWVWAGQDAVVGGAGGCRGLVEVSIEGEGKAEGGRGGFGDGSGAGGGCPERKW